MLKQFFNLDRWFSQIVNKIILLIILLMEKKLQSFRSPQQLMRTIYSQKTTKKRVSTGKTLITEPSPKQLLIKLSQQKDGNYSLQYKKSRQPLTIKRSKVLSETKPSFQKRCHSSSEFLDLPGHLDKTIKIKNADKQKRSIKLVKQKRKKNTFKEYQPQEKYIDIQKGQPTIRKISKTLDDYQVLYKRTERLLQEYQEREQLWENEKTTLMEELEDLRRKSMGMALTSCSSYSLNRKHFF